MVVLTIKVSKNTLEIGFTRWNDGKDLGNIKYNYFTKYYESLIFL